MFVYIGYIEKHLNVNSFPSASIIGWFHLISHVYLGLFSSEYKEHIRKYNIVMLKLSNLGRYYLLLKYIYITITITISKVQLQLTEITLAVKAPRV